MIFFYVEENAGKYKNYNFYVPKLFYIESVHISQNKYYRKITRITMMLQKYGFSRFENS